jgi:DNA-binding beta-propeller fold protein YncE
MMKSFLLSIFILIASVASAQTGAEVAANYGKRGPQQVIELPDSGLWFNVLSPFKFSERKNKILVLNYWSPGEVNARETIALLEEFATENKEVELLTIYKPSSPLDADPAIIVRNIRSFGINHSVFMPASMEAFAPMNFHAFPSTTVVLGGGELFTNHSGMQGVKTMISNLSGLLEGAGDVGNFSSSSPTYGKLGKSQPNPLVKQPHVALFSEKSQDLFIADTGHNRILISTTEGEVIANIGNGSTGFIDGVGHKAKFNTPMGIALDEKNQILYVADTYNHAIRRVDLVDYRVTTILGSGESAQMSAEEVFGTSGRISYPTHIELRGGKLFIAMTGLNQIWEMDVISNKARPVAGNGKRGNGDGKALEVALNAPRSFAFTDDGKMLILDVDRRSIVQWDVSKEIKTVFVDEEGVLDYPTTIAAGGGRVFVGDYNKQQVFELVKNKLQVIAGTGSFGADEGKFSKSAFRGIVSMSLNGDKLTIADAGCNMVRLLDLKKQRLTNQRFTNLENLGRLEHAILHGEKIMLPEVGLGDGENFIDININLDQGYESLFIGRREASMEDKFGYNEMLLADVTGGKLTVGAAGREDNLLARFELYLVFADLDIPGSVFVEAYQVIIPYSFSPRNGTRHDVSLTPTKAYIKDDVVRPVTFHSGRK